MPASSIAWSRRRPAGPTKGRPARSSRSPGCSPTNITSAVLRPSPNTVCVPDFQRSHALQPAAASLSLGRPPRSGSSSSADCTRLLASFDELDAVTVGILDETQSRAAFADRVRRPLRLDPLLFQALQRRVEVLHADGDVAVARPE